MQHNERRLYHAVTSAILELIRAMVREVGLFLLVGHNPGLHDPALGLVGSAAESDRARLQQKFPTAGLIVIDFEIEGWDHAAMGGSQLERFETPKTVD